MVLTAEDRIDKNKIYIFPSRSRTGKDEVQSFTEFLNYFWKFFKCNVGAMVQQIKNISTKPVEIGFSE
jgi:hypothetical protein